MIITLPLYRHPGLDPGSITTGAAWTPDQACPERRRRVRGDEERKAAIAREVAQFSGLLP